MTQPHENRPPPGPEPSGRRAAGPVLPYRSEAADARPPSAPNVLAGGVCLLLVIPCALVTVGLVAFALEQDREPAKRVITAVLALAAAGTVPCCVAAARHHFRPRPPVTFEDDEPPEAEDSGLGPGTPGP